MQGAAIVARFNGIPEIESSLAGAGLRVGVVMSRFNIDVTEGLLSACTGELRKLGVSADNTLIVTVAGALEIPLTLKRMAASGRFDALIALGAVIRGETYHFEVVSDNATSGVSAVQLETGVPIANGILTTDNDDQAMARMSVKGAEAARVAVEMANLMKQIDGRR
jgi:6,7-dimethyl-8-ribityllumazine synthase